jgi:c-di-GMP-binding flagellar brake protein YcgR
MSDEIDKRRFRRVAVGTRVAYSGEPLDPISRDYFESLTGNLSAGGMYLAAKVTFPPGTLLHLRFDAVGGAQDDSPVRATAIVRWRRRFFAPRGMGIEFVEFEGLGKRQLEEWLATVFAATELDR